MMAGRRHGDSVLFRFGQKLLNAISWRMKSRIRRLGKQKKTWFHKTPFLLNVVLYMRVYGGETPTQVDNKIGSADKKKEEKKFGLEWEVTRACRHTICPPQERRRATLVAFFVRPRLVSSRTPTLVQAEPKKKSHPTLIFSRGVCQWPVKVKESVVGRDNIDILTNRWTQNKTCAERWIHFQLSNDRLPLFFQILVDPPWDFQYPDSTTA